MAPSNIHPSSTIGPRVEVALDARIGPNCYIDGCTKIGANTHLVGGITLVGDAEIADNCLIEPGVSITNMPVPTHGSNHPQGAITVGPGTRVGAGSVLARGVHIGTNVQIQVGAFVCRNVPSHAVVSGNPAAIVGYDAPASDRNSATRAQNKDAKPLKDRTSSVIGVRFYTFPIISDARGDLCVGEFGPDFPFDPKRYFIVCNVPAAASRGEHAHWECEELLICLQGSVVVVVDDGTNREEIALDSPNVGLYIGPRVWRVQYKYSTNCIMMVLASLHYEPTDYIWDYESFLVNQRSRV